MSAQLSPAHSPASNEKIGVLLINLGTPDGTDYWSVRRYLGEFLSDPRVIETPKWLWWPLLNLGILSTRPQKSGEAYALIWDREQNDSPLRVITKAQQVNLAQRLAGENIVVDYAMRYGNPSIRSALDKMEQEGCRRILLVPLYPQYSATTTATANDKAFDALRNMRWQPAVRTAPAYYADPQYVAALGDSIRDGVAALDFEPDVVLTSYHGLPQSYVDRGDPYERHCHETTRLACEYLGWPAEKMKVTFQSRFGPTQWLTPATDTTLEELPKQGKKKVAVLAPAFHADCIETLEEISIAGRESFLKAGGEKFAYISCLNDSTASMDFIEAMVRRELSGWL
ncbi:ferrochelatase [Devosia sp. YIM 151766]|uniref:ferrochelatase n=1 Tax=Devosia sp. YIM 151766 TaxID=3017325 RepID=UPI00255C69A7|nr:ferrochelatase [Devosia sp. YIM 151766]WIY51846.1 ferrochelatase [Devosia sp. YIM 151766]